MTTTLPGPDPGGPVADGRRTRGNEFVVRIYDEKRLVLFCWQRDEYEDPKTLRLLLPMG